MDMNARNDWVQLCQIDEIPLLGSRLVERADGNIAVFRSAATVLPERFTRPTVPV